MYSTKQKGIIQNLNRNSISKFQNKYKYAMGGSVPVSMLRYLYKDLAQDPSRTSRNNKLDERDPQLVFE